MYLVEFKGAKSNLDQLPVTFTTPGGRTFTVVSDGEPLKNQIDQVIINADGGTFTASTWDKFTSGLAYNMSIDVSDRFAVWRRRQREMQCHGLGTSNPFLVEYVAARRPRRCQLVLMSPALVGSPDGRRRVAVWCRRSRKSGSIRI